MKDQLRDGKPLACSAPNSTIPDATPAAVTLYRAVHRSPEPPPLEYHAAVVSWRRPHWPIDRPTARRGFDTLEEAAEFRALLERPERDRIIGAGACLARIDVLHGRFRGTGRWIEFADTYQRPEIWRVPA